MHGLGNDFIVLDARVDTLPAMTGSIASALADRREGIGCDQLILLEPSDEHAFRMRIFNSDGGEVEACGNASRAVALLHGAPAHVETAGGVIALEPADGGASVDMGQPRFDPFLQRACVQDEVTVGMFGMQLPEQAGAFEHMPVGRKAKIAERGPCVHPA